MLNCTFIGIKTDSYKQLVSSVLAISKKHSIKTNLKHINEIEDILQTEARAIPSLRILPGNILLFNPSFNEIEQAILENLIQKNYQI